MQPLEKLAPAPLRSLRCEPRCGFPKSAESPRSAVAARNISYIIRPRDAKLALEELEVAATVELFLGASPPELFS